jgi:hypothetical protein
VVKPLFIRPGYGWLSLAKSHFPLKSIVTTRSGSEQYQLINAVDKRHARTHQTEDPHPPQSRGSSMAGSLSAYHC